MMQNAVKTLISAFLAFGTSLLGVSVAAQEAAPSITLTPSSDWELKEEDESCRVSRDFGEGKRKATLYIRSYGPMGAYKVMIVGQSMPSDDSRAHLLRGSFDEDGERDPIDLFAIASTSSGVPMVSFQAVGPRPTDFFGRGWSKDTGGRIGIILRTYSDELMLSGPNMQSHLFKIGKMEAPLAMLDQCETGLLGKWGFDAETEASLSQLPELINRDRINYWIKYPAELIVSHKSTIVQFRIAVDSTGKVSDCKVQASNWSKKNQRQLCRAITKGAEFKPALDAQGNPVKALYRASHMMIRFD